MGSDHSDGEEPDVDQGEYWRMEEMEIRSEVYCFVGRGGPPSATAVSKAKQQFAQDYDVKFRHTVGKKIATAPGRSGGAIVAVFERPRRAAQEASGLGD